MSYILTALKKSEQERALEAPGAPSARPEVETGVEHHVVPKFGGPSWPWIGAGGLMLAGGVAAALALTGGSDDQLAEIATADPAPVAAEPAPALMTTVAAVTTVVEPRPGIEAPSPAAPSPAAAEANAQAIAPSSPPPPDLAKNAEPTLARTTIAALTTPSRPAPVDQLVMLNDDALPTRGERFHEPVATPSLPEQRLAIQAPAPPPAARRIDTAVPGQPAKQNAAIQSLEPRSRADAVDATPTPRPVLDDEYMIEDAVPHLAPPPAPEPALAAETALPSEPAEPVADDVPHEPVQVAALPTRPATADETRVASALYEQGWTLERDGDFRAALDAFTRAIDVRPGFGDAYFGRAWVNDRLDRLDAAVSDYGLTLQLDPNFAPAHANRGVARLYQDDLADAEADFARALELGDNEMRRYAVLWRYLARERDGRMGGGQLLGDTQDLDLGPWPGVIARYFLGEVTTEQVLSDAQASGPMERRERLCVAYFFLGQKQLLAGDTVRAKDYFRKATETDVTAFVQYTASHRELRRLQNRN